MSPRKTKNADETPAQEVNEEKKAKRTRKTKETPKEEPNEVKEIKPKRKCSEKQLAALAEGRKKNPRLMAKIKKEEEEAKNKEATQNPETTF